MDELIDKLVEEKQISPNKPALLNFVNRKLKERYITPGQAAQILDHRDFKKAAVGKNVPVNRTIKFVAKCVSDNNENISELMRLVNCDEETAVTLMTSRYPRWVATRIQGN